MDNGDQELRLGFSADTSQIANATAALKDYLTASDAVEASQEGLAASAQDAGQALNASLSDTFAQLRSEAKDTSSELDDLRDSIKGVKDEANEDDGGGSGLGGLGSSRRFLGAVGGLANRVAPGAGSVLSGAGDVVEIAKDFDKVKDSVTELGTAAIAAAGGVVPLVTTIGLIAAPVIAAGVAIKMFTDLVAEQTKMVNDTVSALKSDTDQRLKEIDTIHNATSKQIEDENTLNQLKLNELETEKQARQAFLTDIQNQYAALGSTFDPAKRAALGDAGQAAQKAIDDITAQEKQYTDSINENTNVILPAIKAREDETAAIERQNAATEKEVTLRTSENDLLQNGTVKSVQDRINQLQNENFAISQVISEGKVSNDELVKLGQRLNDNNTEVNDLQTNILKEVQAREDENAAIQKQQKLVEDSASIYSKYLDATKQADDQYQADELKAQNDYYAKIQDIAAQATKQAADLLLKLNQKYEDLQTQLQNQEADDATRLQQTQLEDQIKFQRDQQKLAEDHQAKLKQIIEDAQKQQQDLIANRDFSGLFNLKKTTDDKIQAENDQYAQSRQAQIDAYNQQEDDEKRHYAEQEQARLVDYNRQIQQAQLAYQRQSAQDAQNQKDALNKAQNAYNQQLQALEDKHTQELQLIQQNAVQSLQLLSQTDQEKLNIEQQYYQDSLNLLKGAASGVSGGSTQTGATGGGGGVNLAASMNGPNYRGNSGGGSSIVNNNNQSASIPITVNGAGHPAVTANAIKAIVAQTLKEYIGQ